MHPIVFKLVCNKNKERCAQNNLNYEKVSSICSNNDKCL